MDLGTNSIGWAVVDRDEEGHCSLVDRGVHIFKDGVSHEKSGEQPAVAKRTASRQLRRQYFRRRLRKIELLKVLIDNNLCPTLPVDALEQWRRFKKFPLDKDFLDWQRTDDSKGKNPYYDRHICLTKTLNLDKKEDRYILGRALYHINQRRGFLSSRKQQLDGDDGVVKSSIDNLSNEIDTSGYVYLGEFLYHLYGKEKLRCRYTARKEHYENEFKAICEKQRLPESLVKSLYRAIFYQRDLKSQKGQVGHCTFEKNKPRIPVSHPRFEEFRMWTFINSIRISRFGEEFLPLNQEEINKIYPLFFRKSKPSFDFEDIAKKIAGKGNYADSDSSKHVAYVFNYRMDKDVPGCPVIASIIAATGIDPCLDWDLKVCETYTRGDGKSLEQIINDIWHALHSFSNSDMLSSWLSGALQISKESADLLVKVPLRTEYSSLSLKAINKVLPWLKKGYIYSKAVFMANIPSVLPDNTSKQKLEEVEENVDILITDYSNNPLNKGISLSKVVTDYLTGAAPNVRIARLYHPSMIDTYQKAIPDKEGKVRLASPRTDAFRNPMALRSLFRLRHLVNTLLDEDIINPLTKINIEFSRELNDANKRKAIQDYQKQNNDARNEARKVIAEYFYGQGRNYEPSEEDIDKYILYEEQNHICFYTGRNIGLSSFLGSMNEFDIEHTVPRSRGGDDSMMNKTLCESHFNRFIKRNKLPSELANSSEILARIEPFKKSIENFEKQLNALERRKRSATTKEQKDTIIRQIHLVRMRKDYVKGKYDRFIMKEVPDNFSNRQGVDIGIIGKYAKMYLETVFGKAYIVKGATTAAFRKAWGIQSDEKKNRDSHAHHCLDAITIACIGKEQYDTWKDYTIKEEEYELGYGVRPVYEKPWPTFTEDVLQIPNSLIVSHYTPDNLLRHTRKKVRARGKLLRADDGQVMYATGHGIRGEIHNDTFYGAIKRDDEIQYVVRKPLDSIREKDVDSIVDDVVRGKVNDAIQQYGSLKEAVAKGIWMNEAKRVPIRKVRVYCPTVKNPISLKKQRFLSEKDYKNDYHVINSGNYCMAIYGDNKRSFRVYSNLEVGSGYDSKNDFLSSIPVSDKDNQPLNYILKIGKMVLFYENNPEELYSCSEVELSKRLYECIGLSTMTIQNKYNYGISVFRHHNESRKLSDLIPKSGLWKQNEEYRPIISINHNQFRFLVEGVHFELSVTGRIVFLSPPNND